VSAGAVRRILGGLSVVLCITALGNAQSAEEMARIAQSPYEIERFVEKTPAFEWEPLWKALHIQEQIVLPSCEERLDAMRDCESELLTISEPAQVLLLLRNEFFETYLRFLPQNAPDGEMRWRFAGHFEPFVKYFPPTHKVVIIGDAPYLQVTGQGDAGTCLSSEVEHWIDLSAMDFEPVFSYTVKGHLCMAPTPDRDTNAFVVSVKTQPESRVTINYGVEFSLDLDSGTRLHLGGRADKVVYVRGQDEKYHVDSGLSTLASEEVKRLYESFIDLTPQEFLRYDEQLNEIASGPDSPEKRWLRSFLRTCPASPEKSALDRLLRPVPRKQAH
jgi:hypothetical protein